MRKFLTVTAAVLCLMLVSSTSTAQARDFGTDLSAEEISRVLYLAISCAQRDRVVVRSYDMSRINTAVRKYYDRLGRLKNITDLIDATDDFVDRVTWAKASTSQKYFVDALTGEDRAWPSYCDKDTMYSDGGSRYEKWYTPAILAEYGQAIRASADKWKIPATGLIMHGMTESNMMMLLSQGNCTPVKDAKGNYVLNPKTLIPLCAKPIVPTEAAWVDGVPGIDYGAWQVSYSLATRGLTKQERKEWVQRVGTVAGAADIAGKWWHRAGGPRCEPAIAQGAWKRPCGAFPEPKAQSGLSVEENTALWRKKVSGYLYCNSCRGSYALFGYGVAYAGRKFAENSGHRDTYEWRIRPALQKVREERQLGLQERAPVLIP